MKNDTDVDADLRYIRRRLDSAGLDAVKIRALAIDPRYPGAWAYVRLTIEHDRQLASAGGHGPNFRRAAWKALRRLFEHLRQLGRDDPSVRVFAGNTMTADTARACLDALRDARREAKA